MVIVDAQVIASLFFRGDATPYCEAAYLQDPAWSSPPFWRSEFRAILKNMQRARNLAPADCEAVIRLAEEKLHPRQYRVDATLAFQIAFQHPTVSAYSIEYVALAEELNVQLLTLDESLLRVFPKRAVSPLRYAQV